MVTASPQFHRRLSADERPKSERFLQYFQQKQDSKYGAERSSSCSSETVPTVYISKESDDPTISELALEKLMEISVTHEDRRKFLCKLARKLDPDYDDQECRNDTESRMDNSQERSLFDCNCRDPPQSTVGSSPSESLHRQASATSSQQTRLSISQRLARAARYSEVKERIALSKAPAVQQKDQKREVLNLRLSERLRKASEFIKRANVAAKRNKSEKDEKLRFFLEYVEECIFEIDAESSHKKRSASNSLLSRNKETALTAPYITDTSHNSDICVCHDDENASNGGNGPETKESYTKKISLSDLNDGLSEKTTASGNDSVGLNTTHTVDEVSVSNSRSRNEVAASTKQSNWSGSNANEDTKNVAEYFQRVVHIILGENTNFDSGKPAQFPPVNSEGLKHDECSARTA